jgi:ketosteroid isomerase-like protein
MDNSKEETLVQQYVDAYNTFDIEGMVALLHHDVEFRNISDGEIEVETKGKEDFRQLAEESKNIFSERCQTIKQFHFSNDRVEIEIDYEATLAVDLPMGLNAGEKLQLQGKSVFQIKEDKFVLIEDYS